MNEQLTNYIQESLAKGVPQDQIRQALLTSGCRQVDIDAAFSQLQFPQQVNPLVPNQIKHTVNTKFLLIGVAILIFLGVLSTTTYLFLNNDSAKSDSAEENSTNENQTSDSKEADKVFLENSKKIFEETFGAGIQLQTRLKEEGKISKEAIETYKNSLTDSYSKTKALKTSSPEAAKLKSDLLNLYKDTRDIADEWVGMTLEQKTAWDSQSDEQKRLNKLLGEIFSQFSSLQTKFNTS